MSEVLRVALVAEGPTDQVVIEAALKAMLDPRPVVVHQLQPERSLAFESFGSLGTGWVGVYRWCQQAVRRGQGRLSGDALLFGQWDLLVIHLDVDVAEKSYADGSLTPSALDGTLPCERPCPPATSAANALLAVLLTWCREPTLPPCTVACLPSKNTEAWVLAALFPGDPAVARTLECLPDPERRLAQQPASQRIRKHVRAYQDRQEDLVEAWPRVAGPRGLEQAARFQADLLTALPPDRHHAPPGL